MMHSTGKVTEFDISEPKADISENTQAKGAAIDNVDIKFGYCTEFIIMLDKEFNEKTEQEFKAFLSSIGDSIVCVALDDIKKYMFIQTILVRHLKKHLNMDSLQK